MCVGESVRESPREETGAERSYLMRGKEGGLLTVRGRQ